MANAGVVNGFNLTLLLVIGAFKSLVVGVVGFWSLTVSVITFEASVPRWPQIFKLWNRPTFLESLW